MHTHYSCMQNNEETIAKYVVNSIGLGWRCHLQAGRPRRIVLLPTSQRIFLKIRFFGVSLPYMDLSYPNMACIIIIFVSQMKHLGRWVGNNPWQRHPAYGILILLRYKVRTLVELLYSIGLGWRCPFQA